MTTNGILVLAIAMMEGAIAPASAEQASREESVLRALDADEDGSISCDELRRYLDPVVQKALRDAGIEPRTTSSVPACGSRTQPGPSADDEKARAPEKNYDEFFRDLIQSALNAATSVSASDHAVARDEVGEMLAVALPLPLSGTYATLLPQPPSTITRQAWTDTLEKWVDVRQSFLDEQGIAKPAKISYTGHGKNDETLKPTDATRVYAIAASIVLTPQFEWTVPDRFHVRPVAAYEANVSSDTPARDQIVHRVGLSSIFVRRDSTAPFSSHLIDLTFDYSTDRGYKAEVYGATVQYSPNYRRIGIGQYLGRGGQFDFRWRPYAGIVWNNVVKAGDVEAYQKQKDFTHAYVRLSGEVKATSRIKVTPEATFWHGERTAADGVVTHWQVQRLLEARLILSQSKGVDRTSLALTMAYGRKSPDFLNEKKTVLALAVKF